MVLHRRSTDRQSADSDVAYELTEIAFHGLLPTVALGAVGLIGSTIQVALIYRDSFLWALSVLMTLLAIFRALMVVKVDRAAQAKVQATVLLRLHSIYTVVSTLYYCTLACSTLHCFRYHLVAAQLICVIGVFIMCTGINGRTVARPAAAMGGGIILLAALGIAIFNPHDPIAITEDLLIGVFTLAHCQAVKSKYEVAVDQIRVRHKLRLLSEHDSLTGLVNRRRFELELEMLCRRERPFAVLFIDLDRFKPVNDNYGHGVGDALLKAVAGRLLDTVRKEDIVARHGGDEFAVLVVPATSRGAAEALAGRINQRIAEPFVIEGHSIDIGTSIGVAVSHPGTTSAAELLSQADAALYQSKQTGRGSFVTAS